MAEFQGSIEHIVYRSAETGYSVLIAVEDGEEKTLVGVLPDLSPGENIKATGRMVIHQNYGEQFQVESYEVLEMQGRDAVERYLSSGAVRGIGDAMARRIVKKFADDTMRIIEEEPERLAEIKGISMKKAMDISAQLNARRDSREAMIFLQGYGISARLAGKIYEQYHNGVYDILKENPYRLTEDIDGVGFQKCDEIALRTGTGRDDPFRINAGISYTLMRAEGSGHSFLPLELLHQEAEQLLRTEITDFMGSLTDLQMQGKIKVQENRVYRAALYYMEQDVAARLLELAGHPQSERAVTEQEVDAVASKEGLALDPLQRQAVLLCMQSGVLVITGGPGTGKTTTIRTILSLCRKEGKNLLLAAPTGRAAKRMTEATGQEAKTIHRLLEFQARQEDAAENADVRGHFERNASNPLECDGIIIDEMSMVDLSLMQALLRAVPSGVHLILVGDANQLPSVGAGNVLRDILKSQVIPSIRLTHIFRQAQESDIVMNAHRIHDGEAVDLSKSSRDFLFIRGGSPESILNSIVMLLLDKLPNYLHSDPLSLQVMTPQRKGVLGVEHLNQILQDRLNPRDRKKPEKELNGVIFRLGDKVMQVRNDYSLVWEIRGKFGIATESGEGVFNGDIGMITEINPFSETMTVDFDGRFVEYAFSDCENLELAYAITIHKSQGSEYPACIIPMYPGPRMLMNRNLLYTAVTRARRCVCLVGNPRIFEEMLKNSQELKRYSSLAEMLQGQSRGS